MAKKRLSPLKVLASQAHKSALMRLMGAKGLTQNDVAQCLGVTSRTVAHWTSGKTTPRLSLKEWDKLAKFLGTTIDKLPRNFAPKD